MVPGRFLEGRGWPVAVTRRRHSSCLTVIYRYQSLPIAPGPVNSCHLLTLLVPLSLPSLTLAPALPPRHSSLPHPHPRTRPRSHFVRSLFPSASPRPPPLAPLTSPTFTRPPPLAPPPHLAPLHSLAAVALRTHKSRGRSVAVSLCPAYMCNPGMCVAVSMCTAGMCFFSLRALLSFFLRARMHASASRHIYQHHGARVHPQPQP